MNKNYLQFVKTTNGGRAIKLAKEYLEKKDSFMCMTILKGLGVQMDSILQVSRLTFGEVTKKGHEYISVSLN